MTIGVSSVRASASRLIVYFDRSPWRTPEGNRAMRIITRFTGRCGYGGGANWVELRCNGSALTDINTRAKLQAVLDARSNVAMVPMLCDVSVIAVRNGGQRYTLEDAKGVERARAAGHPIVIQALLTTNLPLTDRDMEALRGDLCHGVYPVKDRLQHASVVHNMFDDPTSPWQVIRDMKAFVERTLA